MTTIIDSLLVKLGLDSSDYDKGRQKVDQGLKTTGNEADKAGKKLKTAGKDGAAGFNDMAKSATKFLAIVGGTSVLKSFIQDSIESSAALDRFSKNLGRSADEISALSNAAEIAGGSAEGLQGTLGMLSKAQTELQLTGSSGLIPYFSALGVSMTQAGKARSGIDMLLDMSDRFATMDRPTANNMGQMMGIDPGTMNLLLKGRQEVELMIRRQKEYGAVTKKQAEEASRFRQGMIETRLEVSAFGRDLLSSVLPYLEKFLSLFDGFGNWVKDNKEFVLGFLSILTAGVAALGAASIPIDLLAVAFVAAAAGIALLWDDYQKFKAGGDSFAPWADWAPAIDLASQALTGFREILSGLYFRLFAVIDGLNSLRKGDLKGAKIALQLFREGMSFDTNQTPAPPSGGGKVGGGTAGAMAYFQAQGWTKEQAAGIAANLHAESKFDPAALGDSGKAYGIAQWHPDRQAEFQKKFGKPIQGSSVEDQLAFVQYELTQGARVGAGNRLRGATSAQEAGGIVSQFYESPRDKYGEIAKRGSLATQLLNGVPGATGAADIAGGPSGAGGGNRSVSTTVGEVKVYTAATDANGIVKDMATALNYLSTSQANAGLS